jgi:hypothetical protein
MLEARFYVGLRDKETHEQHYEVEKYKEKNGAEREMQNASSQTNWALRY